LNYVLQVTVKNNNEEIPLLHDRVENLGQRIGLSPMVLNAVNVSLEEVLVNLNSYGYADRHEHAIEIRIALEEDGRLRIEVEDDGRFFNPLDAPEPDVTKPLEARPIGGLGLFLVRNLMDELSYQRHRDRNLLIMHKKIDG
jgi:anti-sigma regulatory factor (Ser/Thr protein kinase)